MSVSGSSAALLAALDREPWKQLSLRQTSRRRAVDQVSRNCRWALERNSELDNEEKVSNQQTENLASEQTQTYSYS